MSLLPDPAYLSLEEKVAQLIFPRLGSNLPPPVHAEDDVERVGALLDQYPFGGLIVFNGSARETPASLRALQNRSRFPLLVATDMEAGLGQQFEGATVFPHAMAFSKVPGDAARYVTEAARIAALEALAAGVHITFAPVADVHRNRRNPIISIRAFSSDPIEAGRLAAAYIRGANEVGLLTTAKHFPGHGGTADDSHATLPVVDDDRETLDRTDLLPFRACIEAGVDLVMTAHVAYPALDPEKKAATLSAPILNELLRGELGFEGAVISDSMMMAGVRHTDASPDAKLLMAGVDILLDPVDPIRAVKEITAAAEGGAVTAEALDAAVTRVVALKQRLIDRHGGGVFERPAEVAPGSEPGSARHREFAVRIAASALTCSDEEHPVLRRVRDPHSRVTMALFPSLRSLPLSRSLVESTRRLAPASRVVVVEPESDAQSMLAEIGEPDVLVAAVLVRPAAWHAYGLSRAQELVIQGAVERAPSILAVLGSEDLLGQLPDADVSICLHSDMPPSQEALATFLFEGREHQR